MYTTVGMLIGFVGLALVLLCFWFMLYLLDSKFKRKQRFRSKFVTFLVLLLLLVLYFILAGLGLLDHEVMGNVALTLAVFLYLLGYALLCLEGPMLQKMFWAIIAASFYFISNLAANVAFSLIEPGISIDNDANYMSVMQATIVGLVIQGLITSILVRRQTVSTKMSPLILVLLIAIPAISCFAMLFLTNFAVVNYDHPDVPGLNLLLSISLLVINLAAFALYNYMTKMNARNLTQQKELQKAELERVYLAEIQTLYQETRTWRHDFRNHVQSIKALFLMRNDEALADYLDKIDKSTDKIEMRVNSGNELLDAIINTKIARAEENGVRVTSDISLQQELAIDSVDLTTLVGNLLDNAIEAAEKVVVSPEGRDAFIAVEITDTNQNQLMISVRNAMVGEVVTNEGKFATTKTSGDHGIGMQQIDSVIEKYDGFISRKAGDGEFVALARLRLGFDK